MIFELYSDNTGMCRFHRKWSEKTVPVLVNELLEQNIDYYKHHKRLAHEIDQVHDKSVFWESERVIDIILKYLEKLQVGDPDNSVLNEWIDKFHNDKWGAAREYWDLVSKGIKDGLKIRDYRNILNKKNLIRMQWWIFISKI